MSPPLGVWNTNTPIPLVSDEAQGNGTRKATFDLELCVNRAGVPFLNPANTVTCDFTFPDNPAAVFVAVDPILIEGADPPDIGASVGMGSTPAAGPCNTTHVQFLYRATGAYPGTLQVSMVMYYR
jgi:hypothetical protein